MSSSPESLDIHLIAIGGTGMAPLACLLDEAGHRVRGSDGPLYPPMSTLLEKAGIRPAVGYRAENLEPRPDLVVVGNAVPRTNPEVEAMERLGLPRLSMPETLARFFLTGRRPLVAAGTHGKTTTTSIAAWVYTSCGAEPGYLVGGVPRNLERSFESGRGERFIVEGDEYNAAYFDRGPKFLHYQPQTLILTSVEYDHADLYPDPESLLAAYRKLVALLPPEGLLIACGDSKEVREVAAEAACPVVFYGLGEDDNDLFPLGGLDRGPEGSRFEVADAEVGSVELELGVPGEHNVLNALAVWAAARHDGLDPEAVRSALAGFRGVRRRLEELGTERGVTVVDDFAHHPTAVEKSLEALSRHYPGRRRIACFEPRSLTAGRDFFAEAYRRAFAGTDVLLLAPIFHRGRLSDEERLDLEGLCRDLEAAGKAARACESVDEVLSLALETARAGDVVVTMSSGDFRGLPHRLFEALAAPSSR